MLCANYRIIGIIAAEIFAEEQDAVYAELFLRHYRQRKKKQ